MRKSRFSEEQIIGILHANLFTNLEEAKRVIEEWRQDYNTLRPHGSLGGMSPDEYRRASTGENLNNQSPNLSVVYPEGEGQIATRYDKLAIAYLSFLHVAAIAVWLR